MMQAPELPLFDYQPQPYRGRSAEEVLRLRRQFLNPGIFLYYKRPLMIVEGKGQYVFDEQGRRYLDALGGIVTISVGHCHPDVVEAGVLVGECKSVGATKVGLEAEPGEMLASRFDLALFDVYTGQHDARKSETENPQHRANATADLKQTCPRDKRCSSQNQLVPPMVGLLQ